MLDYSVKYETTNFIILLSTRQQIVTLFNNLLKTNELVFFKLKYDSASKILNESLPCAYARAFGSEQPRVPVDFGMFVARASEQQHAAALHSHGSTDQIY